MYNMIIYIAKFKTISDSHFYTESFFRKVVFIHVVHTLHKYQTNISDITVLWIYCFSSYEQNICHWKKVCFCEIFG